MKKQINKILAILCSSLLVMSSARATTIVLGENAGIVEVYQADGTQISTTTNSALGSALGNNMAMRFGTFINGFTPTVANASSWFNNFVGVNGYVTLMNAASNAGKLSGSITGGNSQTISSPVTSDSGVGVNGSASIASSSLLYAILWNTSYVSNATGGNTFYPTDPDLQAAIIGNSAWTMPTTSGIDTTIYSYTFSSGTGSTALVGSIDNSTKGITLSLVPEPSTGALMLIGAVGLVAMRRFRKA
jgi:hypothetical protein